MPSDRAPAPTAATDPLTERALEALRARWPDGVEDARTDGQHPWIRLRADALRDACFFLRDDPAFAFDCCHLVSGVDYLDEGQMEVLYHLVSYTRPSEPAYRTRAAKNDPWLCLKVRVPRERPEVPTVMDIWTGADWHERETYDLVGIRFTGRKELRRILLPEDWPGHPLRKDWEYPASYHGTPIIPPEGL